jgi:hypothetical protein
MRANGIAMMANDATFEAGAAKAACGSQLMAAGANVTGTDAQVLVGAASMLSGIRAPSGGSTFIRGGSMGGGGGPGRLIVYRGLSAADRAALEAGRGLTPAGVGGTIADQVAGIETKYISASLSAGTPGAGAYSTHGVVAIDVGKAIEGGAGYVEHGNVLQALDRAGTAESYANASRDLEVLFKGTIPADAIWPIRW